MGKSPHMPLSRALSWIFLNVCLVSGVAWTCFGVYTYLWEARRDDPRYHIASIVQTGAEKEALKTSYLEEILGLSKENGQNLYRLDLKSAANQLLACPLMEEVSLKRIPPGTLYIDYTVRSPCAFLGDAANTAMDAKGVLFPFHPFFSPKKLPILVLGVGKEDLIWGKKIENSKYLLAFEVLKELERRKNQIQVVKIDVSKADAESLGKRQIVAIVNNREKGIEHTLILNGERYAEGIERYETLLNLTLDSFQVVDLRLDQLAYLQG
jgi:hypothetical protein